MDCCCSVAQLCPTLQPHALQHARLPCSSPSPRVCSDSRPLSNDVIQPSHPLLPPSPAALNLSQHQGFPRESALPIRCPKYWSFSVSPSNEYPGFISFRIDWLISLQSEGLARVFSSTTIQQNQFFSTQHSLAPTLTSIHGYWKNHSFDYSDLYQKK